jgi:hypothetical protein
MPGAPFRPDFEPALTNNHLLKGQLACKKELFGGFSRYAVYAVHTRFDRVEWQVADCDVIDPVTGGPGIIRQGDTKREVLEGLV